jgi:anoctamin-10/anoctamin-7
VFILQVTNMLYEKLALYLTELENHRTETAYEDSLIAKTFMFQFVNSYASLIYIAFVKQHLEGCAPDCMTELGTTLGTIFITRYAPL